MSNHAVAAIAVAWTVVTAIQSDGGGVEAAVVSGLIVAGVVILATWLVLPYAKRAFLRRWGLNIDVVKSERIDENTTGLQVVVSGRRFISPFTIESINFCCVPTRSIRSDAPRYSEETVFTRAAAPLGRKDRPSPTCTTANDKFNGLTVNFLTPETLTISADSRERFQVVVEARDTVDGYVSAMAYSDAGNRVRGRLLADDVLETPTEKPGWRARLGLAST